MTSHLVGQFSGQFGRATVAEESATVKELLVPLGMLLVLALLLMFFVNMLKGLFRADPSKQARADRPARAHLKTDPSTDIPEPLRAPVVAKPEAIHDGPCWVEFVFPPKPTGSWLGGLPSMPDDVSWPTGDGKPMQFFAQINLADVPRTTWGGLQPEQGWLLLFFGSRGGRVASAAIYTAGLGRPRQPPEGTEPYYLEYPLRNMLDYILCGAAPVLPRWPIRIRPVDEPPSVRSGGSLSNRVPKHDLSDPAWHPFDRLSQRMMLAAAMEELRSGLRAMGHRDLTQPPDVDPSTERGQAMRHCYGLWQRYALALSEDAQDEGDNLSPMLDAHVQDLLHGVPYTWMAYNKTKRKKLLHSEFQSSSFVAAFEFAARHAFLTCPDGLPARVRDLFEPHWREATAREIMALGGMPTSYMEEYGFVGAKLLELPSSHVMGWEFGDGSDAAFSIDGADLAAGNWDRAQYADSHGL
ncbi:MAG: DUF1963 domain-containing protein [Pseudomonadota bacterium]